MPMSSKLDLGGARVAVPTDEAIGIAEGILQRVGCDRETAQTVAKHLVDANLCGIESHGLWRVLQYAEYYQSGFLRTNVRPEVRENERGALEVDGKGGIGIPAMDLATERVCEQAKQAGVAALAVRHVGHTGRVGAYGEAAALSGCLAIIIGGGGRQKWRQVAPHGGRKALFSTNPYCIAVPGGDRGPVVLDFATSKIAGGWIYAARNAGALLPEGAVIDAQGNPTRHPEDYFNGGAILPAAGAKGYALAVAAEMIGEAMLGPVDTELSWLMIALDVARYREPTVLQAAAEEVLAEIRACPTAPGVERVEIPGERERDLRAANERVGISLPEKTWNDIVALAQRLGVQRGEARLG